MSELLFHHFRNERLQSHRPFKATLELTYRCNERCSHCYLESFRDDKNKLLTLSDWKIVLKKLKDGGVLYLDLIGGEPMLHPHFWEILQEASQLGFFVGMISNGLKIDSSAARRLKEIGISDVTLSLYSLESSIHDQMTNVVGSHEKILKAIEHLQAARLPVRLNCLLTRDNIDHYFELEDWCREKKLVILPDPYITAKTNGDLAPLKMRASENQLQKFYRRKFARDGVKQLAQESDPENYVCGAGKLKCAVTRYGELLTCLEIRESLGSLVTSDFDELWFHSPIAKKWRELKNKDLNCSSCEHCPGAAMQENNKATHVTDYSRMIQRSKNLALTMMISI